MTTCACNIFEFVLYKFSLCTISRFVTFVAGHTLMFPVEFEPGTVVIEFLCFPVIKRMTSITIVLTLCFKLFIMDIIMAGITILCKIVEFLHNFFVRLFKMTTPARGLKMFS